MIACGVMKRKRGSRLFPYRCETCSAYHIGHNPRRAREQDAEKARKRPWI